MGIIAVQFGALLFESAGLMHVEAVLSVSTVGEILALNMLKNDLKVTLSE